MQPCCSAPLLLIAVLIFASASSVAAQDVRPPSTPPPPSLSTTDSARPEERAAQDATPSDGTPQSGTRSARKTCGASALNLCLKDFLHDQAGIWASPARIRSRDLFWLLPFAGATGAAIATDNRALQTLGHPNNFVRGTRYFSNIGSPYTIAGVSGAFYLAGSLSHNSTARETGVLGLEALADTAVVVQALKLATNRDRPDQGDGDGDFWPHGTRSFSWNGSFPSMHAAGSWALARIIASEYPHPAVKILVYTLAVGVTATRVTGRKHFPSDVLVGGVTGYLIGGYVYRHRSEAARDEYSYTILPFSDPRTHSVGLTIAVKPETLGNALRALTSHASTRSN